MREKTVLIAPSLLAADFGQLSAEVKRMNGWRVDRVHIDIMDGHFVPNMTFGPQVISSIRGATRMPFETHLMISNPHRHVKSFIDAGSDIVIVHCEAERNANRSIGLIKRYGAKAGIAISPQTKFEAVKHYLPKVDTLLIMSVHPGFGGQKFMPAALQKIRKAREQIDKLGCGTIISVDGGIDVGAARAAVAAGADELVAGTAIFKSRDIRKAIRALKGLKIR